MRDPNRPPFWQWLKDYWTFHQQERKNIIVLTAMIFLLLAVQLYLKITGPERNRASVEFLGPEHFKELQVKMDSTNESNRQKRESNWTKRSEKDPWNPEPFNPNDLDSAAWRKIGLSPKQAAVMVRIKEERGGFKSKRELEKLRMISFIYPSIEPYLQLPDSVVYEKYRPRKRKDSVYPKKQFEKLSIELNSADSAELTRLFGIGPSFAKRIVKYRGMLGGFVSPDQLLEVYGMDTVRYNRLKDEVLVNPFDIETINLNSADIEMLKKHPYIRYNLAKAIVNYRTQHGPFNSVSDLSKIHLIKPETLEKLRPYMEVE